MTYIWAIPPHGFVRLAEDLTVIEMPEGVTLKGARMFGDRPFLLLGLPDGRNLATGPNDVRVQDGGDEC